MDSDALNRLADKIVKDIKNPEDLQKLFGLLYFKVSAKTAKQTATAQQTQSHDDISIPLSCYSNDTLTILETTVLYLHRKELRLTDIAYHLRRSEQSLWRTLHTAKKKGAGLVFKESENRVPVSLFAAKTKGSLPALVLFCKNTLAMRNKEIAQLLHRDERTISSVISKDRRRTP